MILELELELVFFLKMWDYYFDSHLMFQQKNYNNQSYYYNITLQEMTSIFDEEKGQCITSLHEW